MESKLRIKLYDNNWLLTSDRLVTQSIELKKGPTETHNGPLVVEFVLSDKEQAEQAIQYMGKLIGNLPLETPQSPKANKTLNKKMADKDSINDLLNLIDQKCKYQEDVINFLMELNFKFQDFQFLCDLKHIEPDFKDSIDKKYHDRFFMARLIKEAKHPKNDKYDTRLVFIINLDGPTRSPNIIYYAWGEKGIMKKPWKDKQGTNFKKPEFLFTFPEYMDENERMNWRNERKKVDTDPNYQPTKFYLKWAKYVKAK